MISKTLNFKTLSLWMIALLLSCSKDKIADYPRQIQEISNNAKGEFITLESGATVQKRGVNYFIEGDLLLTPSQFELIKTNNSFEAIAKEDLDQPYQNASPASSGRLFKTNSSTKSKSVGVHPNANRMWAMVRYTVNSNVSAGARLAISAAIQHIESTTNIRFYNATGQPTYDYQWEFYYPYIEFFHGTSTDPSAWNKEGNWSTVGRWDAVKNPATQGRGDAGQWLSLQQDKSLGPLFPPSSVRMGIVAHEIMHAIGLFHEHTRPERDNTITVHPDRCRLTGNDYKMNFDKRTGSYFMFGSSVDLNSIMMYGMTDYAKDVNFPVITLNAGGTYPVNRTALSDLDRSYANYFYLPYIARSDVYRELAATVYKSDNTVMTAQERLSLQAYLNYGNPNPPNCCRLTNNHINL